MDDASLSAYGKAGAIPPCEVKCDMDRFENMIREYGVFLICEWFGHDKDSDFTKSTIKVLCERSGITKEFLTQ